MGAGAAPVELILYLVPLRPNPFLWLGLNFGDT
jgi:hypothetical protein